MSDNEQGVLFPFHLSGSRMRRSAAQMRRYGQVVDALILVRRAAEQEDTPSAWLALARELRLTANWEAAAQLLARVISREPEHPEAWLELSHCLRALGLTELALNCAFHQLRLAMHAVDVDRVDEIRSTIAELHNPEEEHEIHREQRLLHRTLSAWRGGDRALGERRLRRLLRITRDKEQLLTSAAMLCMMELDLDGAQKYLTKAQRYNPHSPRILTALASLYSQRGKLRLARGLLQKAGQYADTVLAEDSFLTAAWAQDAWAEMAAFLAKRRRITPYRTAMRAAEAGMLMETDRQQDAWEMWKDIVAINPEDRYAAAMLACFPAGEEYFIIVPGRIPRRVRVQQMEQLTQAAARGEELMKIGSANRRLLDWLLSSDEEAERRCAMGLLEGNDSEEAVGFLKELLCRPFLPGETREWALRRLTRLGGCDQAPILLGSAYSVIRCCNPDMPHEPRPWRDFLAALLSVTRRRRRSNEIVAYAADIWRQLPAAVRRRAGSKTYTWAVAVEALFLLGQGEAEAAIRTMKDSYMSPCRIYRVIRRIRRCVN